MISTPQISIIVPTFNRCQELPAALDALCCQQGLEEGAYEVIVVDNNSTDRTKEIVKEYIGRYKSIVRYAFEVKQGISAARNRGIGQSQGEIIAFTDDDVRVAPQWIFYLKKAFESPLVDAVGGRVVPAYSSDIPRWVKENQSIFYGVIVHHDYGQEEILYSVPPMVPFIGANFAIRRVILLQYGLFREDIGVGQGFLGEDSEMYWRLKLADKKIYYYGMAEVLHPIDQNRLKWDYMAKWAWQYGRFRGRIEREKTAYSQFFQWIGSPKSLILFAAVFGANLLRLVLSLIFFYKRGVIKSWFTLYIQLGMFYEYRWHTKNRMGGPL